MSQSVKRQTGPTLFAFLNAVQQLGSPKFEEIETALSRHLPFLFLGEDRSLKGYVKGLVLFKFLVTSNDGSTIRYSITERGSARLASLLSRYHGRDPWDGVLPAEPSAIDS